MRLMLLVGMAGFFGAVSRYLVGGWVYRMLPSSFPFGTLAVNIIGSLLLGAVFQLGTERAVLSPEVRVAIGTGFLGAFTTFSSFSLETVNLLKEGSLLLATLNVGGNVLLCLGAVMLGMALVRML